MENQNKKFTTTEILAKIKSGQIKMKSRSYFAAETAAIIAGIVFVFFLAIFLSSAVHFFAHASGLWYFPGFGITEFKIFFFNVPWLLIASIIFSGGALFWLIKKISASYRQPIIYSLVAIFAIIFSSSFVFAQYPLHEKLFQYSQDKNIPLMKSFYQRYGQMPCHNAIIGKIASTTDSGFLVTPPDRQDNEQNDIFNVFISPDTNLPKEKKLEKDSTILIISDQKIKKNINAASIRKIRLDEKIPPGLSKSCRP